ncbi:MAG TPA: aminotransferase class V-fold PLP-dependent enzyme [Patescibacteria group bacterium]|nr:aminotransferase class V-fold PLP-dependent enzyme [Patescibacteria group bacterium]
MSAPRFTEEYLRRSVWPRFSRVLAREEIYLANHSLGRPPDRMAENVRAALDVWYCDMGDAWQFWLQQQERFRELTATLVGAPRADCIVPKTNAGQGLRAVLNALPGKPRVATSDGEFDSLDFILRVYREQRRIDLKIAPWRELSVAGADLVVFSSVMFRTGEVVENLPNLVRGAHLAGALVLLDVYHHAGVVSLDLEALGVDFAVGGSYKYTRGGPGACWLYVRPGLAETMRTLDIGWFAKKDVFSYARPEPPEYGRGGDAWLESTPPVLAPVQALAGLEFTLELGVERLRTHNLAQKSRLASLLFEQGVEATGVGDAHGAFLTVVHPESGTIARQLHEKGVKVDARGEYLRICPDILNSDAELERAARLIGAVINEQ